MCTISYTDDGSLRTVCASRQYRAANRWPDAVKRDFDAPRSQIIFIDDNNWINFLARGDES